MSGKITKSTDTSNHARFDYEFSQFLLGKNKTIQVEYENKTGAVKEIARGLLVGRKHADGKVLPLQHDATDGSQYPLGFVINDTKTVANDAVVKLTLVISGEINENGVVLESGTTMDSVISDRRLKDRIAADTEGIYLVKTAENTL